MKFITRVFILSALITLIVLLQYALGCGHVSIYSQYVFQPFQAFRNWLFKTLPFSVGDFLFISAALLFLYWLYRVVHSCLQWRTHGHTLRHRLLQFLTVVVVAYLWFLVGWGGNYFKPPLAKYWQMDSLQSAPIDALRQYDSFLVNQLNRLAPTYKEQSFETTNHRSRLYYVSFTKNDSHYSGLQAKPSLFGYYIQYVGTQGYYNPFTGEAQVNKRLPSFILPFVICHEMAHQSGVASEEDANLLSYALCSQVPDNGYNYSAYFYLWLYTNGRLKASDSTLAKNMESQLNPLSKQHFEIFLAISKKYQSSFQRWSASMYNSFLKMNRQKDGLRSYGNVVFSAWMLEQKRAANGSLTLSLP